MKALKRISLFIIIAFIFATVFSLYFVKSYADTNDREIKSTYIQDFSSSSSISNDFRLCYQSEKGAESEWSTLGDTSATMRWDMASDSTGSYVQCNGPASSFDNDRGAQGSAIMTYTGKKYVNFRLTVDYKKDAGTFYWPVVAFRQLLVGKTFNEDGIGVLVQKEGFVTLWGCSDAGGPYESAPVADYEDGNTPYEWHTMVVDMYGVDCNIYIDPIGSNPAPAFSKKFSESMFRGGYISLIAINNRSSFKNLKIEEYSVERLENYEEDPIESPNTEDSIDNIISNSGPFSVKFMEKDGTTLIEEKTVDYNETTISPTAPQPEEGYHFVGFVDEYGAVFKDGETKITGKITLVATYELNSYNVSFYMDDDSLLMVVQVSFGSSIDIPIAPEREGYEFDGYYSGDEKLTNETVFYSDASYMAKYSKTINPDDLLEGWSMFGCGANINSISAVSGFIAIGLAVIVLKRIIGKKIEK